MFITWEIFGQVVVVPTIKTGQAEHIKTYFCCYLSPGSQHSTDFKYVSNHFVSGG